MSVTRLPVLFVSDLVVLPGMVVPIELDEAAQAAVNSSTSPRASTEPPMLVRSRPKAVRTIACDGKEVGAAWWRNRREWPIGGMLR